MRERFKIKKKSDKKTLENDFIYSIDLPKSQIQKNRGISLRGWVFARRDKKIKALRVVNGKKVHKIPYGFERKDVKKHYPGVDEKKARWSGFELDFEFEDGLIEIEVDSGDGYKELTSLNLIYKGGTSKGTEFNPFLAERWVDHIDLLETKSRYFYEPKINAKISLSKRDPKLIAFYLPQFHPIPENDKAWGKGFTEWTNVAVAKPRFVGHHQPMLPSDLGFYDLRLDSVIEEQINLAKSHGIYAFCFYYYWFSGKRLLDRPLDSFLRHNEWDFNFMICWANENWTKRWDGADKEVIVSQKYLKDDPINFIKDVEHILLDPRYIKINGKPALCVYRLPHLKNAKKYASVWREYFLKKHNLELHLIGVLSHTVDNPSDFGFDAAIEFVPSGITHKSHKFINASIPRVDVKNKQIDLEFEDPIADYRTIVLDDKFHKESYKFPAYRCVMPSWDNDARRKGRGSTVFYNSSPDLYGKWLSNELKLAKKTNYPVFINAWNEWAESTVLEPSQMYGHAMLNRTAETLALHSSVQSNRNTFPIYGIKKTHVVDLAVIVQLYSEEEWEYLQKRLKLLENNKYDIFICLQKKDKDLDKKIKKVFKRAYIFNLSDRGRDMLPFIHIARRVSQAGYKSILKLSAKSNIQSEDFNENYKNTINNILPSKTGINKMLKIISTQKSMIGPRGHLASIDSNLEKNNVLIKKIIKSIYGSRNGDKVFSEAVPYSYFDGGTFWVNIELLKPLLNLYLMPEDFELEYGQKDGTTAHALERLIGVVSKLEGATIYQANRWNIKKVSSS